MLDLRLKMFKSDRLRRSCAPSRSSILHPQSHILPLSLSTSSINNLTSNIQRSALTLIELLVVIVILTTLVGGVIPILSPNNDVRKIQVAARGLQGYINLTQAQAARTGRPSGIGFRESSPESGVALEVFGWEVLPPFAGFSTESRIRVSLLAGAPVYNAAKYPQYMGFPLYRLGLELAGGAVTADILPPRTFRVGDIVDVDGNQFFIVDDGRNYEEKFAPSPILYLDPAQNPSGSVNSITCVWMNNSGQVAPQGLKRYKIRRQPTTSSAPPYQLPAGIVIDMQASVTEGNTVGNRFPTDSALFVDPAYRPTPADSDTVGIMFSPTGAVDSVVFNGNELDSVSRIVLMLGRIENGGLTGNEWVMNTGDTDDQLEEKQKEINWLNLDSRLLSIVASNGRAVVSEPAFVDARRFGADPADVQADEQLEAAHSFAHEMTTAK